MRQIEIAEARQMALEMLINSGFSDSNAEKIIRNVLECELTGQKAHGLARLENIIKTQKKISNVTPISLTQIAPNCILVDGGQNNGIVAIEKAIDAALNFNLKDNPISMIAVKNYSGNTGVLGNYARKLADNDLISIFFGSSSPRVAPYNGMEPILGTNPMAVGVPNGDNPIIIDFSTAAITAGEISIAAREHRALPEGTILDKDGNSSTNPHDAKDGVQLPMAGHKGYALGLMMDLFANVFTGAMNSDNVNKSIGTMIIIQKPDIFISKQKFLETLNLRLGVIKKSKLAVGATEIRIPGDKYKTLLNKNLQSGKISVSQELYCSFTKLYKDLCVSNMYEVTKKTAA